jgi:predicted DCC family thiol-disulfide oxidoreductase YuxK
VGETTSLLVYDGSCGFCTNCKEWLETRLRAPSSMVIVDSRNFSDDDLLAMHLDRALVNSTLCWCSDERVETGAGAVSKALINARGAWRLVGRVLRVAPVSWVAEFAYRVVAKNRYRLPGASASCASPVTTSDPTT